MIVEVSAKRFAVPFECPCCGAAPDTEMTIPLANARPHAPESARGLGFPYCRKCEQHVTHWEAAGVGATGVMVLGVIGGVILAVTTRVVFGLAVLGAAIPLALALRSIRRSQAKEGCGPSCATPGKALQYLGWSGNVSAFQFASLVYAARFAEQNSKILVNISSQLRQLLEGHKIARLAVPTPAAAHVVVPAAPSVLDWIARIQSSRGGVARRNSLLRALEAVHDPREREEVLQAASRIEVAAILAKVDALASSIAKKRELQNAIAAIRVDNMPEELQDAELRQLEARLKELG
jgi:hypothetical protein